MIEVLLVIFIITSGALGYVLYRSLGRLSFYEDMYSDMYPKDKFRWETKEFVKPAGAKEGMEQSTGEEVLIMNY